MSLRRVVQPTPMQPIDYKPTLTLLTIPITWTAQEGEFVAFFGGQHLIVDSGSSALVFDLGHGPGPTHDEATYEKLEYGSETLWCVPMHADIKVADGTVRRVESHKIMLRSKAGPRHAGIMGLAFCWKDEPGAWERLTPEKRKETFSESVWSLVPRADHVRLDGNNGTLQWLTDNQASASTDHPAHERDIQFFTHRLADGRTLQFIGWRTSKSNGKTVLFETGCTYSKTTLLSNVSPKPDLVFGNADMLGKRFWFNLKRGKVMVDDDGEGLIAELNDVHYRPTLGR